MRASYANVTIKLAKVDLFKTLLKLDYEDLTLSEHEILFLLSSDPDTQEVLQSKIRMEKH